MLTLSTPTSATSSPSNRACRRLRISPSFLDEVDHRLLVLLDELEPGRDPPRDRRSPGALLDALRQRRCTIFVATHYPEPAYKAHNTPGVQNASMEFDVETLAPTYRWTISSWSIERPRHRPAGRRAPQSIVKRAG